MSHSEPGHLGKQLGFFHAFCIAGGAMVSSGLFVLPGLAHAQAGPAVVFSYFFAGLLAATGMLSVAEIITAMPKAGGDYSFITRTMGPAAGAVAGLLSWFSRSLKADFALVGKSTFLTPLLGWPPLLVIGFFYVAMVFVTSGVLGPAELDHSLTPVFDGARAFFGPGGAALMCVAAGLAFVSTANAGIMAASRYLLALSRDELIPAVFSRVGPRSGSPVTAVLLPGLFVIGSLFLDTHVLIKSASTVLILTYLLSNLCVVVLRESRLLNYRPTFRSPGYPWIQLAGSGGFVLLILEMGLKALLISLVLVLGGLAFSWFYGRIKVTREFALLHLMDPVLDRSLTEGVLESELSEIIRERDELCSDPFEEVVNRAQILDLPGPLDRDAFVFFLILASRDKRDSYLRTLASLAQIVGNPSFERHWRTAKSEDLLRDVLRLTQRKRVCTVPGDTER